MKHPLVVVFSPLVSIPQIHQARNWQDLRYCYCCVVIYREKMQNVHIVRSNIREVIQVVYNIQ